MSSIVGSEIMETVVSELIFYEKTVTKIFDNDRKDVIETKNVIEARPPWK